MLYPMFTPSMNPMMPMAPHAFGLGRYMTGNRDYDSMLNTLLYTGDAILVAALVCGVFIGLDQLHKKVIVPTIYRPSFRRIRKSLENGGCELKHASAISKVALSVAEEKGLINKALFDEDVLSAYEKISKIETIHSILRNSQKIEPLVIAATLEKLGYREQMHEVEKLIDTVDFSQFSFDAADTAAFALTRADALARSINKANLDKLKKDIQKVKELAKKENLSFYQAYQKLEYDLDELPTIFFRADSDIDRYFIASIFEKAELKFDEKTDAEILLEDAGLSVETANMLRALKVSLAQQQLEHFLTESSNIYSVQVDYTFGASTRKGAGIVLVSRAVVDKEYLKKFKNSELSLAETVQALKVDELARMELLIAAIEEVNSLSRENSSKDAMKKLQLKMADSSFSDEIVKKVQSEGYRQRMQRELEKIAEETFGREWKEKLKDPENLHKITELYIREQIDQRTDLRDALSNPASSAVVEHLLNMADPSIFSNRDFIKIRKNKYSAPNSAIAEVIAKSLVKGLPFGGQLAVKLESELRGMHSVKAEEYVNKNRHLFESDVKLTESELAEIKANIKKRAKDRYLAHCITELEKVDYVIEKFMHSRNIPEVAKAVFSHDAELFRSLQSKDISNTALTYLDTTEHEARFAFAINNLEENKRKEIIEHLNIEDLRSIRAGNVDDVLQKYNAQIETSDVDYEGALQLKSKFSISELSRLTTKSSTENVKGCVNAIKDKHFDAYQLFAESYTTTPTVKTKGMIDFSADQEQLNNFIFSDSAELLAEVKSKEYMKHGSAVAVENELKAVSQVKPYAETIASFNKKSEHSPQDYLKLLVSVHPEKAAEMLSITLSTQIQFQREAKRIFDFHMESEHDFKGFKKASRKVERLRKKLLSKTFEIDGQTISMAESLRFSEAFVDTIRAQTKDESLNIREALKAAIYVDGSSELLYEDGIRAYSSNCFGANALRKSQYRPKINREIVELAATFKESTGASFQDFSAVSNNHEQIMKITKELFERSYAIGLTDEEVAAMLDKLSEGVDRTLEINDPKDVKYVLAKEPARYADEALRRLSYEKAKVDTSKPQLEMQDESLRKTLASMLEERLPERRSTSL